MTSETRERILIALNLLLAENERETQNRRSVVASIGIGSRRKALMDAITIVRDTH